MASFVAAKGSNNAGGGTSIDMLVPTVFARGTFGGANDRGYQILYGGGVWVMAGEDVTTSPATPKIWTSPDLVTWTARTLTGASTDNACVIGYDGTTWLAVAGNGKTWTATDPTLAWSARAALPSNIGSGAADGRDGPFFGNGVWVVAQSISAGNKIAVTADPVAGTWTQYTVGVTGDQWGGLGYGNGRWVLTVASNGTTLSELGQIYTATDPTGTWTEVQTAWVHTAGSLSGALRGVAYGNGRWVIAGYNGSSVPALQYGSGDAASWTNVAPAPPSAALASGVAFLNNQFVATMGGDSTPSFIIYYCSPDGLTWTPYPVQLTASDNLYNILATDGTKYAFPTSVTGGAVYKATQEINLRWSLWIMSIDVVGGTGTTITDPAGWTLLGSQVNSTTALARKLYVRIPDGTVYKYTVTITSNKASGCIVAIGSADQGTPVTAQFAQQANASSLTVTAPTLGSWAADNGIDLFFGGFAADPTTTPPPTNYTDASCRSSSTGGGASSRTTSAAAYRVLSNVTTVGAISAVWTGTAAVNIGGHVFIFDTPIAKHGRGGGGGKKGSQAYDRGLEIYQAVQRSSLY